MQGYLTSTRFISLKVSISVAKNSYYFINQNKKKNKKKINTYSDFLLNSKKYSMTSLQI